MTFNTLVSKQLLLYKSQALVSTQERLGLATLRLVQEGLSEKKTNHKTTALKLLRNCAPAQWHMKLDNTRVVLL